MRFKLNDFVYLVNIKDVVKLEDTYMVEVANDTPTDAIRLATTDERAKSQIGRYS